MNKAFPVRVRTVLPRGVQATAPGGRRSGAGVLLVPTGAVRSISAERGRLAEIGVGPAHPLAGPAFPLHERNSAVRGRSDRRAPACVNPPRRGWSPQPERTFAPESADSAFGRVGGGRREPRAANCENSSKVFPTAPVAGVRRRVGPHSAARIGRPRGKAADNSRSGRTGTPFRAAEWPRAGCDRTWNTEVGCIVRHRAEGWLAGARELERERVHW